MQWLLFNWRLEQCVPARSLHVWSPLCHSIGSKLARIHSAIFSAFRWRNHIPKLNITFPSEVLVSSDERPYRKFTFHNVSARQGSSYCNRARLNFQAFALRDMNIATWEGFPKGQKMSYHFSFCKVNSACNRRSSRAIIFRFNSKTQWQMFLLLYRRHVCVPQKDTDMAPPYKSL